MNALTPLTASRSLFYRSSIQPNLPFLYQTFFNKKYTTCTSTSHVVQHLKLSLFFYSCFGKPIPESRYNLNLFGQNGKKEIKASPTMSVPRSDCVKSPFVVGHDCKRKMFYVELQDKVKNEDGSVAKLEYEWVRTGLVDLYHTETPPALQGQGIAKLLVLAALNHFCEKDVLIRPSCTYVQKVLRENPTPLYRDHVEENYLSSL